MNNSQIPDDIYKIIISYIFPIVTKNDIDKSSLMKSKFYKDVHGGSTSYGVYMQHYNYLSSCEMLRTEHGYKYNNEKQYPVSYCKTSSIIHYGSCNCNLFDF